MYLLDFGGDLNADYCVFRARTAGFGGGLFVCLEPLLTEQMIASEHVTPGAAMPPGVVRVGGGLGRRETRPDDDYECRNPYLPFRDGVFDESTCRFVLHLYGDLIGPFAEEAARTLRPGGTVRVRLPDWRNEEAQRLVGAITRALERHGLSVVAAEPVPGEGVTVWDEIYEDRAYEIVGRKTAPE
jgi:SAM-dependent methyltransferase